MRFILRHILRGNRLDPTGSAAAILAAQKRARRPRSQGG
ncbi:hypothetical protein CCP3SC1_630005 [Gammaproteobacteria bacterium]